MDNSNKTGGLFSRTVRVRDAAPRIGGDIVRSVIYFNTASDIDRESVFLELLTSEKTKDDAYLICIMAPVTRFELNYAFDVLSMIKINCHIKYVYNPLKWNGDL